MIIFGIDPGLSGGWAVLSDNQVFCGDLPAYNKMINGYELSDIIDAHDIGLAVVESVNVMPGQGIASSGRFMRAYGQCLGVVAAHKLPIKHPTPQKWKRDLGLTPPSKDMSKSQQTIFKKEQARQVASDLYPRFARMWARKKDHNRAEAVLIAHWGEKHGNAD